MDQRPIHYEPHPVSPGRKAELVKQGVRILDAKFAPPGWSTPSAVTLTGVVPALTVAQGDKRAERPGDDMETDDLKAVLDAKGIHYRSNASRASLFALLRSE
jgi:hypothetical protein